MQRIGFRKWMTVSLMAATLALGAGLRADEQVEAKTAEGEIPTDIRELFRKRFEDGDKSDLKPFPEATKGFEKRSGFINLWVDAKKNKLMAEIPSKMLGKDLLLATSGTRGSVAGFQLTESLLRFERREDRIVIVQPNTFYTGEGRIKQIVDNTYPDSVLATTDIVSESPDQGLLIDMRALLVNQSGALIGFRPPSIVEDVTKAKAFPKNSVVEISFRSRDGAIGIYYSFNELPSNDYKPRVADQRVGYFLTARKNFSKDERADTIFDRYINRWHLKKADPSLALSPPEEPIVFYIEDSVPVKYRRYVREGILEWNKAFEKIGISEAVVARQQTANNEFADLDPEDARYNFFRWIASERAFAMGPSRTDPRTGQILDADIIMDESMVRSYLNNYDLMVNSIDSLKANTSPQMKEALARNPHMAPDWERIAEYYAGLIATDSSLKGETPESLFARDMRDDVSAIRDSKVCTLGTEMSREFFMAQLGLNFMMNEAAQAEGADKGGDKPGDAKDGEKKEDGKKKKSLEEWPEEFVGQVVKEIVMHEVGHTLGLRHNFKASSWKSYEEVVANKDPNVPTVASVMDYIPLSFKADGTKPDVWVMQTVGPYDEWAIEYGYAQPGTNERPKDEGEMLKKILAKSNEPGHVYMTDEDVTLLDPVINRFDLGTNPLDYTVARIALADKIMPKLLDVVVKDNESYTKVRDAYRLLMSQRFSAASLATKYIGGHDVRRVYKVEGDNRVPVTVVPAKDQRAAFKLIQECVFAEDAFKIDPKMQGYLAASRWSHEGSSDWIQPLALPIQDDILSMQRSVLFSLLQPERLKNMYDSEFRVAEGEDVFSLPEMFRGLSDAIVGEILAGKVSRGSDRKPGIGNLRRNLQREYVANLITIATQPERGSMYPAAARTLAWKQLKDLGDKIDAMVGKGRDAYDSYTQAHLEETATRIRKALDANFSVGGTSGGGGFFLFGQPAPGDAQAEGKVPTHPVNPYLR